MDEMERSSDEERLCANYLAVSPFTCPYFQRAFSHFVNKTVLERDVSTTCPNLPKKYKSQSKYEPTGSH